VMMGENDMSSLVELYLLREAKKRGLLCLTIQSMAPQQALSANPCRDEDESHGG
jgi:hypothetical protein